MTDQESAIRELETLIPDLPEKDRDFAQSLVNQFHRRGGLSPKQWPWVDKLAHPPKDDNLGGNLVPMLTMFKIAGEKLKTPKIRLLLDTGEKVKVYPAKKGSRNEGMLYVRGLAYYGKIDPKSGTFYPSFDSHEAVSRALHTFAEDPVQAATAYGLALGECCFCERELSDERSKRVGYGPVCARNFDLPWGD